LLKARLVKSTGIIADALSGVSGAGRKVELDYLFAECNESARPYGIPKHRHLSGNRGAVEFGGGRIGGHSVFTAFDSGQPRDTGHSLRGAGKAF